MSSYVSSNEFKAIVDISGTSNTFDDAAILLALESASEALRIGYSRDFALTATTSKYFIPRSPAYLDVTDLISTTAIAIDTSANATYSTTLLTANYILEPQNATRYQRIRIAPLSTQAFWPGYRVRVTGNWGYVETSGSPPASGAPPSVKQACVILANRLLQRKNAPFGVLGAGDMGNPVRLAREDPDVKMLMAPFDLSEAAWVIA